MFRRRWSGLPADPIFANNLTELGYFVNDIDEIRSIEDPDNYFKFFMYKNERWNERQRFAFNEAITNIIHTRLSARGLVSLSLPLNTPTANPHVPIRTSPSLASHSRVILLFGQSSQEFGVLSHRVIGHQGGVTKGSVLSLLDGLGTQQSSAADPSPPGVVLANCGELWWWPEGGRGLTPTARHRVPMSSAVHFGRYHDGCKNEVDGNRSVAEHVRCVFESVVFGGLVEAYLDDERVWGKVGGMMNALVVLGGFYDSARFKCEGFKTFMKERARAYVVHHDPLDVPVSGPSGNPGVIGFTAYGCPVYSGGEAKEIEALLVDAQPAVLKWLQEVALKGEAYKNDEFEIFGVEPEDLDSPWGEPGADAAEEQDTKAKKSEAADAKAVDHGVINDKKEGDDSDDMAKDNKANSEGDEPKPGSAGNAHDEVKAAAALAMGIEELKLKN